MDGDISITSCGLIFTIARYEMSNAFVANYGRFTKVNQYNSPLLA